MATSDTFDLTKITKEAINNRIKEIAEEEYAEALKRIEQRRPEAVMGVCLAVEKYVSYERIGQELRVTVKSINN